MGDPTVNFKNYKQRGEWVEMMFMARAAEEGLQVSKPYGDSAAYDFIVEHGARCLRVQVKSTSHKHQAGHGCHVRGSNSRPYADNSFDIVAVYLVRMGLWYILPLASIAGLKDLYFSPGIRDSKYGPYEEAWHLLRRESSPTAKDTGRAPEEKACDVAVCTNGKDTSFTRAE
jgi:PD-(D/E)XK endonuclease